MQTRTVTCTAAPTPEQAEALKETMFAFNAACNYISGVAFSERVFHRRALQRLVYYEVRARFRLPAQLAVRAIAKVADAYKVSKAVQAQFRPLGAVVYDGRVLRLVSLSSVSLTTLHGRIQVVLNIGSYQRNRLTGATLGETDLLFSSENDRFALAFAVKSKTPPVSETQSFLGVDLGVKNIAADSDGTFYAGGKLRSLRKRHRRLRRRLQKLGTRGARRLLVKRRRKERRHATHVNHGISKKIVAVAQGTGRGVAVEDLTGIRDRTTVRKADRAEHSGWAFHQLRAFLEYKCAAAGVSCVAVDARNTSRTCPACGCVDKRNRPTQAAFRCIQCDLSGHADVIAAREVARRAVVSQPNCPVGNAPRKGSELYQGKAAPREGRRSLTRAPSSPSRGSPARSPAARPRPSARSA
jgi:putative transposase